jgi:adenine-specific DNA methylase
MTIEPFAWKNRPSLIESILPAQKISAEAQKERKAGAGQTLTALGSYWKGRKPLILVKACVLGALLPASSDPAADLAIFEKLMAIDDEAFLRREMIPSCLGLFKRLHSVGWMKEEEAKRLFVIHRRSLIDRKIWEIKPFEITEIDSSVKNRQAYVGWAEGIAATERHSWELRWVQSFNYLERVGEAKRPEELEQGPLFDPVWGEVNSHLGTEAHSMPELVEQLGILRFGHRPKVGDTFCGGGSIPFEAARLGCDAFASDLNPIACMLTWGAINIIGADARRSKQIEATQRAMATAVDREISALGIEHDRGGNRAKAFLYCLETRCPQTGWMVPITGSWIISKTRSVVGRIIPDHATKTFRIEIVKGVDETELANAAKGTTEDGDLVYELDGETYRTRLKTIRGDYRLPDKTTGNTLRPWEKHDFAPRPDDIYQERLYCIQWITKETLDRGRPETFFAAVTEADLERERRVAEIVRQNLAQWQEEGLVPDMVIEPGDKTDEPIRTRGWTYWHHLFNARQLVSLSTFRRLAREHAQGQIGIAKIADYGSRLCRWDAGHMGSSPQAVGTFTNQALNPLANYGTKASGHLGVVFSEAVSSHSPIHGATRIETQPASSLRIDSDIFVTDPPYADAVNYHEITEYFIAWFRKNPPPPFSDWVWDSRRPLAIKGSGDDFRREMVAAYGAMAKHMPDNGLQIVMFTHQDPSVWADMASIVWGAGLQVTAAWYIATETTSELKKGGYVQGTVLLVLRKRAGQASVYRDELAGEIRVEVAKQIDTMVGLNQETKGRGRSENLFEDADLQMAGYAAALRVLTGYRRIDGQDMAAEALRPRQKGERDVAKEMIDYAVTVANEHLVPEGLSASVWERCTGPERFYLKMLDIEAAGIKKLDNYQNFAKAFRVGDYGNLMGSMKANDARLKSATDFKKATFEGEFGSTPLRALLFALFELQREVDSDEVMAHLRELVPGYLNHREDLIAFCQYLASKREGKLPEEAGAARVLLTRIKNERLGG